jgi:hypothetical protein
MTIQSSEIVVYGIEYSCHNDDSCPHMKDTLYVDKEKALEVCREAANYQMEEYVQMGIFEKEFLMMEENADLDVISVIVHQKGAVDSWEIKEFNLVCNPKPPVDYTN